MPTWQEMALFKYHVLHNLHTKIRKNSENVKPYLPLGHVFSVTFRTWS